jgi:hypothetical protein
MKWKLHQSFKTKKKKKLCLLQPVDYSSPSPSADDAQGQETEEGGFSEETGLEQYIITLSGDEIQSALHFLEKADEFNTSEETHSGEFVLEEGDIGSDTTIRNTFIELFLNTDTDTVFCAFPVDSKPRLARDEIVSVYLTGQVLH